MKDYKSLSLPELVKKWQKKRMKLAQTDDKNRKFEDIEELFAMRKEIDRRKGEKKPTVNINFADEYLTD